MTLSESLPALLCFYYTDSAVIYIKHFQDLCNRSLLAFSASRGADSNLCRLIRKSKVKKNFFFLFVANTYVYIYCTYILCLVVSSISTSGYLLRKVQPPFGACLFSEYYTVKIRSILEFLSIIYLLYML
jgi:hypothetical protein